MRLFLLVMMVSSVLAIGMVLPIYAQICYDCDEPHHTTNNTQQNQVKPTDKGSLMVRLYTEPENPTVLGPTTFELSFEDKDTQYPLSNIVYQVSISKGKDLIYETPASNSTQGTAKVQYQFKEPGQYQVTAYVTGMNSRQIPQETASFSLTIGSSAIPEFPFVVPILLISFVSGIIFYRIRFRT